MRTNIVIGSRGSRLALTQTGLVAARLKEANPCIELDIRKIVTQGDRNRQLPLESVGSIGIFVKELEEALLDGRIDLAVHSLKDVPTGLPPGLRLLATLERTDPRDVLVSRGGRLSELAPGSRVGTGSLRRLVQLVRIRPDLEACSIRGNIDTRMRKVSSGEVDAVILAAAALLRMGWQDRITEYLPLDSFLPCVGQGALVLEGRADDKDVAEIVSSINHLPTWRSVMAERAFLLRLGGGCRAPIAALGTVEGSVLKLRGMIADPSGGKLLQDVEEGSAASPEDVGEALAKKLLAQGADELIAGVRCV